MGEKEKLPKKVLDEPEIISYDREELDVAVVFTGDGSPPPTTFPG
jgi:hypothetical protein